MADTTTLMTHADIGEMLGVATRTSRQWRYISKTSSRDRRAPVLPEPVAMSTSKELLFDRAEIIAWAEATGRHIYHRNAGGGHEVKTRL
jgi:hypothetical protein